jgi:hypothetical protein
MKGLNATLASDGYVVIRLEHTADPNKDSAEWLEARRRDMPDPQGFQREFLLNWTVSEGDWFYPNFAREPQRWVAEVPFSPKLPVLRGWDFGYRVPACTWSQLGPDGRLRVLRSLIVNDIDTHSFRDLVMFLSGQDLVVGAPPEKQIRQLERRPRAIEELVKLEKEPLIWESWSNELEEMGIPWFPRGTRFLDYSGTEATQLKSFYSTEGERCDAEVLASAGINLNMLWQPVSYGVRIIRRMLLDHTDGHGPGLLLHPWCEDLINGMAGGLVWPKGTERHPVIDDDEPWKDGYFDNIHDALRYTVVNIIGSAEAVDEIQRSEPRREDPSPEEKYMEDVTAVESNELAFDKWNPLDDEREWFN